MGNPEAAQHVGRYTHISLTLSQDTQSRTERNKNKELVHSAGRSRPLARAGGTPGGEGVGGCT